MSATNVERQIESEHLAHAKRAIDTTLQGWDLLSWNELLADDIVLSLRLGAVDISQIGEVRGFGGDFRVTGQSRAKSVLRSIYGDLRKGLSVTTELISGYDVVLLGNFATTKGAHGFESLPIVIYMAFTPQFKIQKMTIATVNLQPLIDTVRNVALSGAMTSS